MPFCAELRLLFQTGQMLQQQKQHEKLLIYKRLYAVLLLAIVLAIIDLLCQIYVASWVRGAARCSAVQTERGSATFDWVVLRWLPCQSGNRPPCRFECL